MTPKRFGTWPSIFLLTALLGVIMIVIALWGGPPAERPVSTAVPDAGQEIITQTPDPEPSGFATESSSRPATSSTDPPNPPTRTPTLTPSPSPTPLPTATPTSTPTPIRLSPPVLSSLGAVAYVEGERLCVVHPDQVGVTLVSDSVIYDVQTTGWSPNGRWLLFSAGSDAGQPALTLWDRETSKSVRLRDLPNFPLEEGPIQDISWSPGGTRMLFSTTTSSTGRWVLEVGTREIWSIPDSPAGTGPWLDNGVILLSDDAGQSLRLFDTEPPGKALTETLRIDVPYALSPDRSRLAFLEGQADGQRTLSVLSLPGGEPRTLLDQPAIKTDWNGALWSPDGRWFAYGAAEIEPDMTNGPYTLIADTDGGYQTQVFQGVLPRTWSPDGRLLAGFGCSDTKCRFSLIDIVSERVTDIASGRELDLTDVAWSPQATYLTYSLSGSSSSGEGLILWDRGTRQQRVLLKGTETHSATDIQWTPDGCTVYAALREKGAGPDSAVASVWLIGPEWEGRWQIAPRVSQDSPSLVDVLERRDKGRKGQLCLGPLLKDRRLVAFYGTPLGPGLGILGRHGISQTVSLLQQQQQEYQVLDPDVDTVPAFHMVTSVADDYPGADGDYNHRVPHGTIRPWIDAIRLLGGLSILDVQPGRGDLASELDAIDPLLREPDVHLAVDPEFIVGEGEIPGRDLGRITGPQVNYLQWRMEQVARQTGHRKMLIIHQFDDRMIEDKDAILNYPLVDLVWDADGFGGPGSKIGDYNQYSLETGFEYGGFKIFYRYDEPPMTPEQVLALDPPPRLVIYQ